MKISQHINGGTVTYTYIRNWGQENFQMNFGNDQIECHLPEEMMRELHEKLGKAIADIDSERAEKLAEQQEEKESEVDE